MKSNLTSALSGIEESRPDGALAVFAEYPGLRFASPGLSNLAPFGAALLDRGTNVTNSERGCVDTNATAGEGPGVRGPVCRSTVCDRCVVEPRSQGVQPPIREGPVELCCQVLAVASPKSAIAPDGPDGFHYAITPKAFPLTAQGRAAHPGN